MRLKWKNSDAKGKIEERNGPGQREEGRWQREERRKAVWNGMKIVRGRGMLRELRGRVVISPREVRGWDRWKDREMSGPGREERPRFPDLSSNGENSVSLLRPFFAIPSLNCRPRLCARASLVRTNFKKNFRGKGKQKIFLKVDLTPGLSQVWGDKACDSNTFASMTSRADSTEVSTERRRFDE